MNSKFFFMLCLGFGVMVAGLLLLPSEAPARPEIAALQNSPCWKCHINPNGGGQRNVTGFFASQNLALEASTKAIEENFKDFGEFVPAVGDHLLFGMDVRPMWHDIEDDPDIPDEEEGPNSSTFYLMQAAFYADAHLLPILHLTGSFDAAQNTFEAYGLIDELPAGLYFRIGRFHVPYGLRLDDHTVFTRAPLGFHNISQDTGIEAGIRPGPFFLSAAVTNGNPGNQAQDRDGDYYAVTGQTGVRFWKIGIGGSYYANTAQELFRQVYGPWATFGIWKITLLGEFDVFNQEETLEGTGEPRNRMRIGSAAFGMLDVEIIRGLNLQARYAHQDTNWERDETFQDQVMGGILFYPIPYLSTTFQYRYNREPADIEQVNNELLFQAHLFF